VRSVVVTLVALLHAASGGADARSLVSRSGTGRRAVAKPLSWPSDDRLLERQLKNALAEDVHDERLAAVVRAHDDGGEETSKLLELLEDDDSHFVDGSNLSAGAHDGWLSNAVQLPPHAGYAVRDSSRAWGTRQTIALLTHAFDRVTAADPDAPRVRVHDLSLREGGAMDGHKSHQTGRDVDLSYYQQSCAGECVARHVAPEQLDAIRQWRLLRYWLEHDAAEFIFVDYVLQRPLYDAARASGATARQLAAWFQYPRGAGFPAGVVRHVANHANHVHVRFRRR
jgi:hypothetical protein